MERGEDDKSDRLFGGARGLCCLASALLLLSMAGCGTRTTAPATLDRSRALELLRRDPSLTRDAVASIRTGRFPSSCPEFETSDYRDFRRAGFIEYTASSAGELREAHITAHGQQAFQAAGAISSPESACPLTAWKVPLAKREIIDITGVVRDANSAVVEYRWRFVPTAAGAPLGGALYVRDITGATVEDSAVNRYARTVGKGDQASAARAQLLLYDDGWRVVRAAR